MKNTVNCFGYLEDINIKDKLIFPMSLRGCNKEELDELFNLGLMPDEIFKMLPKVPLEGLRSGLKSFTYQRLTSSNNEVIDKFVYLFLIMNDLGNQISRVLINQNMCIINFDEYENKDYEGNIDLLINYLSDILRFKGYYTELMDNEILVLNCHYRTTQEQVDRILSKVNKPGITVTVRDRLENKEECIYRGIAELLGSCSRYDDLKESWIACKDDLRNLNNLNFEQLHKLCYDILHIYSCLNSYKNIDSLVKDTEENAEILKSSIELDVCEEIKQLATDVIDTHCVINLDDNLYAKEFSVARDILEESVLPMEKLIDAYYSPEMKPIRCTRLFEKDLQLFTYDLLYTDLPATKPLAIPKDNLNTEIETIELEDEQDLTSYTNERTNKGFKRYLPIIAITMIVLIAARLVTM